MAVRSGVGYAGQGISCGIRGNGSIECWGPEQDFHWKNIPIPEGSYSDLAVGIYICGVRTNGSIACWGQRQPFSDDEIPEGPFSSVSVGYGHACGLKTDGSVRCWGDDSSGQAYSPPGTFTSVSAGSGFSCGLKPDGSATCWGYTQRR